jgi:hypothetical protein
MYKYLFIYIILISACYSKQPQKFSLKSDSTTREIHNPYDSLKKYSYHLVGISSKPNHPPIIGTAFFIRLNGKLYIASAGHMFNGVETRDSSIINKDTIWDSVKVILFNSKTGKDTPINAPMPKHAIPYYSYQKPDIYISRFDPKGLQVNSIENFISDVSEKKSDKVIYFGFQFSQMRAGSDNYVLFSYEGEAFKYRFLIPDKYTLVPIEDTLNYYSTPNSYQGNSGSPVFLKFSRFENGKIIDEIKFGGILIGLTPQEYNMAQILKTKEVIKCLNSLKR